MLGSLWLRAWLWQPLELAGETPDAPVASGVIHVHTSLSDGSAEPAAVIAAAQELGLEFLILTDHNHVDGKGLEGYHGSLLVLVGTEISTNDGHVLGLGVRRPSFHFSGDGTDALDDVRHLGGSSFAAHPTSPREDFRWQGWERPGKWGIELLNGDAAWRSAGSWQLLRAAFDYTANPRLGLLGTLAGVTPATDEWDDLLAERDVPGIAGPDAHGAVRFGDWELPVPSYGPQLGLVLNHVSLDRPLSRDAEIDTAAVLGGLARGRSHVGVDALASAAGFFFRMETADQSFHMGDTVAPAAGLEAIASGRLPEGATLRLIKDGQVLAESVREIRCGVEAEGVYRVEVHLPQLAVPWVISNPIYVFGEEAAARRAAKAAWPPRVFVETALLIDDFSGATAFHPEFDDASWMNEEIVDPAPPDADGPAARLEFRLGAPGPGRPFTWCALVDRSERDLTGFAGLSLRLKADGEYRLWVQVRDRNPASADAEQEWWFASLRTSTGWESVVLPFERLRSINPNSDGRLDLDQIVGLVFVLDIGAVTPGTEGTVWIDDLGLYE